MQVTVCNKNLATGNLKWYDLHQLFGIHRYEINWETFFCIGICNKSGWNGIFFYFLFRWKSHLSAMYTMFLFVSIFFFFAPVVPFFSPNTAGATAAARFPLQASIHFYKISCCVWIFDSKPNTETQQLKRRSHFGFSCILRDKDLWSLWDEKGKKKSKKHPMRQWSHYILSLGMGLGGLSWCQQTFLTLEIKAKVWRTGVARGSEAAVSSNE